MILFFNGQIATSNSSTTALAVEGNRILALGSDSEILNLEKPDCEKINLNGQCIWPGLFDSHIHLEMFSASLSQVNCETDTLDECLKRVKDTCQKAPSSGSWITGQGWNQNVWGGIFGTATQLDSVSGNHPVFLSDKSIHSAWVNSLALKNAGIDQNTPDPFGGSIQRDVKGFPTGILFENAVSLVEKIIPQPIEAERQSSMLAGQAELHKMGIVGVNDFDRVNCFSTLQQLHLENLLTLRVSKGIPFEQLENAINLGLRSGFGDDTLFIGPVKMFADGALGPQTAAMLTPYENDSQNRGTLLLKADDVFDAGRIATTNGLPLAIHAIGDRATNEVLNGFSMLREYENQNHLPKRLHRIEHLQLLHADDINKAAMMGVVASMQPIHATSDMFTADKHWGKRSRFAYAFASLLEQNTLLIFGSDAPVESPNPFWGIHAAVSRRRQNGDPSEEGWNPKQRITLAQALKAYSETPALVMGKSHNLGKLQPGFYADLQILKQDPQVIESDELYKITPESVMVGGKWVYHKN